MASFMRKDTRKGRKRVKIKIFVTGISLPICNRELKKNRKKLKKLTNTIMAYCPANPGWERQRMSEKKKLSFRSFPTRTQIENRKKNSKKVQKIKKHHIRFFSSQHWVGMVEKW